MRLPLCSPQHGRSRARVIHAVVVIFLEFFAWGLLTTPMLTVSTRTPFAKMCKVLKFS